MPDRDVLDRSSVPAWRGSRRLLTGGAAPPDEVAQAIIPALAKSLRDGGGLPGADHLAAVLSRFQLSELSACEALAALRSVERAFSGHRHTKVATQAVAGLIVQHEHCGSPASEPTEAVSLSFCLQMVDHHLFGRVRAELVGSRFADYGEALAWEQQCKDALRPRLTRLAMALARNPTAVGLRAPLAGIAARLSTADMLHEPVTFEEILR